MSRDGEPKAPIWARPEPRSRGQRGGLSRAEIVQTALKIADSEGLAEVSIRRLARELRAGAMSLYHYFDSRDEILDLMADAVAATMVVPDLPSDWRAALRELANHSRTTFLAHPWMLLTLQERPRVTPNLLRHIEQSAQSVAELGERGVPPEHLAGLVTSVDDYTIGYTLREIANGGGPDRGQRVATEFQNAWDEPHIRYLLESGEFPMLLRFVNLGEPLPTASFEVGLEWLLDGFEASLRR